MLDWRADPITQAPTMQSQLTRVWRADIDAQYQAQKMQREWGGDVAAWLIEAPWAHMAWHSYLINLVHMRPIETGPIAEKSKDLIVYLPGATHELWVQALDPGHPRQPMLETGRWHVLSPCNFTAQFIAETDQRAIDRVERAVQLICDGRLSPDTDYLRAWIALFGDSMVRREVQGASLH
jgi:hypothetical protein